MGIHVIKMPDIGEGIAEVELVAWHVKPGDRVVEDQVLADVMTEKASVEIPSPVTGEVMALGGEIGQVMAVGSELIRLEVEGAGNAKAAASAAAPAAAAVKVDAPAAKPAAAVNKPTMPAAPVPAPSLPAHEPARPLYADRPIASPSVRRRAWELGIDLVQVPASGTAGRIMRADLDAYAARGGARPATRPTAPLIPLAPRGAARNDEEAIKLIGLRRKIAQKMQEAKRRIPHFSYVEEVDVTELEALRARLNAKWGAQRPRLTVLPFLVRALVLALREHPEINARFDDEAGVVTRYGAAHVGIATQTAAGLMVPVLSHAEAHDLWSAAAEIARLAEAARSGKIVRDELSGSTITISSLGPLGGIVTTPVINHPEVAIIGVNRIVERPTIRNGAVVPRLLMNLSSSFDHRVVDGMNAAEFVQALRGYLESPAALFIEP